MSAWVREPRQSLTDAWLADAAALAVAVALAVVVALDVSGVARVLPVLAFVTYVPGRALVANWPAADARSHVALSVILSLSVMVVLATASLWLHVWDPVGQTVALEALGIGALLVAMLRRYRRGSEPRRPGARGPERAL